MLASPAPHTAFTRRSIGVATVTGGVTIPLLRRGPTLTITGEGWGVVTAVSAGLFGGTFLTAEAAGAGGEGAASGINVKGKSEIIPSSLETLALRLKDESPGSVSVMSPDIVLNP